MLKRYTFKKIVAGCDEAGRGCLAGPVVAAAVILPVNFKNEILNDSKKLSKKNRCSLSKIIKNQSISWSIGIASSLEIDKINILNSSFLAMHRAIKKLNVTPEFLLIDGNRFNTYNGIEHECIIKGDAKYLSIASASVLAKTYRDEIMNNLDVKYPRYGWAKNKGYPTKEHRKIISEIGISEHHRKSFQLLSSQLNLEI